MSLRLPEALSHLSRSFHQNLLKSFSEIHFGTGNFLLSCISCLLQEAMAEEPAALCQLFSEFHQNALKGFFKGLFQELVTETPNSFKAKRCFILSNSPKSTETLRT